MVAVPRFSSLLALRPSLGRAAADEGALGAIARMAEAAGAPVSRVLADFAALSLGPGRATLAEFEVLRLYDPAFWGEQDRRLVLGARRGRALALEANFRHDWLALACDPVAAGAYLAAHGLPVRPILAIWREGLAAPGASLLRTRDELRAFLERRAGRPLVARPAEGGHARTLFAGARRDPAAEIDRLLDEIADAPGVGWVFQAPVAPHPALGGQTPPVRLITLGGERGARLFRAVWRLGGRDDHVASLDLKTGQAFWLSPAAAPHRARPAPADLSVPDWPALKAAAVEGARLFGQFGLLGWEIVPGADGPVILGLDPTPDFGLCQLAERRGVLDGELTAFLAERRRAAAAWRAAEAGLA